METSNTSIRLNKFIAMSGITSRRKADNLINGGNVKVNGKIIRTLGVTINPNTDEIIVNGEKIKKLPTRSYYIMNKPKGYICANSSKYGDELVTTLIPDSTIKCVGRLDKNTTGLLILTNDGNLIYNLTHPSNKVEKEYLVRIKGEFNLENLKQLQDGVTIEIEKIQADEKYKEVFFAKPKNAKIVKSTKNESIILITINEGKKREIRLIFNELGFKYIELKRVRIGGLKLNDLKLGNYKKISKEELDESIK